MQVNYVDEYDIAAQLYGMPHPSTLRYLSQQVEQYGGQLSNTVQGFFTDTRTMFNQFNGAEALGKIRRTMRKVGNVFRQDIVRPLVKPADIQLAQPIMQRIIMAEPTTRKLFQQQRCNGYSDSYVDMYPGKIGDNHPDFQRVVNGIIFTESKYGIKVDEDEETGRWVMMDYLPEPDDNNPPMDMSDQVAGMSTWDHQLALMEQHNIDPTDVYNGSL